MRHATLLWSLWQRLLRPFASAFTRPGHRRFVEWATAPALNVEEPAITQSVAAIERVADWKALESFAEYGAWKAEAVTRCLADLIGGAPGRAWHGYRVSAVDDTKVHRSGARAWGTCTSHEYTARCPDRATAVRAHNWVCLGALLRNEGQPAWYLPVSGRLHFRKSQLPPRSGAAGPKEAFRTECELAVELLREQARTGGGAYLDAFDGGYALRNVVRPPVQPEGGSPRIEFLTRLRHDARLHALPPTKRPRGKRGRDPKWGKRLPPPRRGGRWPGPWRTGEAFIYGRVRKVRWKEAACLWRVPGHDATVKAVVACVEGDRKRFALISSAVGLSGLQMVELFAARSRREDGFRDLKQRLGWEEGRARTRKPIERTSRAQSVTTGLLRLLQYGLDAEGCTGRRSPPPRNKKRDRPGVLDVGRLLRRHRGEIRQLLSGWLGDEEKAA